MKLLEAKRRILKSKRRKTLGAPPPPPATWPDVSQFGFWQALPQLSDADYISTITAGNVAIILSSVATSPTTIHEKQVSFGVYKWAQTSFKIDPYVWSTTVFGTSATDPKPRDTIIDADANTWTVRAVDPPQNGSPWRLDCLRLIVEATLCDTISIKKPVDTTDSYLSPLTSQGSPTTPETDIPCRIQFDREEMEKYQGMQFMRSWYKIYVQNLDDNLQIGTVVTATSGEYNGVTFRVISNENIEQIEELEMLTVTIDPVP
jgi:hypothetical protein